MSCAADSMAIYIVMTSFLTRFRIHCQRNKKNNISNWNLILNFATETFKFDLYFGKCCMGKIFERQGWFWDASLLSVFVYCVGFWQWCVVSLGCGQKKKKHNGPRINTAFASPRPPFLSSYCHNKPHKLPLAACNNNKTQRKSKMTATLSLPHLSFCHRLLC